VSNENDSIDEEAGEDAGLNSLSWSGEHIDASDALRERGAAYGMYVNTMRALPDIRDGLKSVQRRIIYSMSMNNQVFNRSTTKCARIVGDTMGRYHPHGDSSIYDALVRLGQPFTVNVPLITPQGNFGSVDGDPAAAMRYTEAKLSPASSAWKADTRPEVLPYRPNFDESVEEPIVLPVSFPLLLVNGSQGIGWSLACDVPPHNLGEAIEAALLVADNPEATLKQILKKMPVPDYPSGGVIANPDVLHDAYQSGRGSFILQGRYALENMPGGGQAVIITQLPYQVGPSQVFQEIIDAAKAEKITEITEKPINLTSKKGTRLVVKLKRGGSPQALTAQLLKYTSLQTTQKVNFTVLRDGTPATVGLPELLTAFVEFRISVVTKRLEHERDVLLKELKRLTALRAALDLIEQVIKIIRSAEDDDQARSKLKAIIKVVPYGQKAKQAIDDEQAENILSMQLRRLSKLNRFALDEEIQGKTDRCLEIDRILSDPQAIIGMVKDELRETKKAFAVDRQTQLSSGSIDSSDGSIEGDGGGEALPDQEITLWAAASGAAIAAPAGSAKSSPLKVAADDSVLLRLATTSNKPLWAFSSAGQCYRVRAGELGIEAKKSRGSQLAAFAKDEKLAAVIEADAEPFLALITAGGEIKRMGSDVMSSAHAGGIAAVNVGEDQLMAVIAHPEGSQLLVHSAQGKALRVDLDAIRPVKSGAAGPVKLMKLADGDRIVSACLIAEAGDLIVMHESGSAKRVPVSEYPLKGRGGGGVASAHPAKPSRAAAGRVTVAAVSEAEEVQVVTSQGRIVKVAPAAAARAGVSKSCLECSPDDTPAIIS
jgi:DNA gyrase subunit A